MEYHFATKALRHNAFNVDNLLCLSAFVANSRASCQTETITTGSKIQHFAYNFVKLVEFISINRMYRPRDFEFISISADDVEKKDRVLKFLQKHQASNKNYLFSGNKYKLIEAIDPAWQGALPYTILVEPGGKVVYRKQGEMDPYELKKTIVNNHLLGKYP